MNVTNLTTSFSNADQSSYTTASISPLANALILAAVAHWSNATIPAPTPTLSGNGLTWVSITTVTLVGGYRLTLFRAMGASPSSGVVTIDFGGDVQGQIEWSIGQVTGVDTSGTHGSGAIVQSATNTVLPGTSLTVTLGAFGHVNNGAFGAFYPNNSRTPAVGSGFALMGMADGGGSQESLLTEWRGDNDTTVDASWPTSSNAAGLAIEIQFSPGYQVAGTDAALRHAKVGAAASGAYALTGTDASLERGFVVAAGAGAYALAGQDAQLIYEPANAYIIAAAGGSYVATGTDASALHGALIGAGAGAYAVTGSSLDLIKAVPAPPIPIHRAIVRLPDPHAGSSTVQYRAGSTIMDTYTADNDTGTADSTAHTADASPMRYT